MKRSFFMAASAVALALTSTASFAAEPVATAPAAGSVSAPAGTESLTDAQRVGRFFRGSARAVGSGLKKTGQFLGKGVNKMIEKGAPKGAAPTANP